MDQDDSMLSTPSSHQDDTYDDDSLFPEPTTDTSHNPSYVAAQTPLNDHLNAAAPGELSPPRSQSIPTNPGQTNGFGTMKSNTLVEDDGDFISDDDEAIDMKGETSRAGGKDDKDRPGAGWKNKKAQEEMARAWENVVDRDFDVKVYGDPLAHKK